MDDEFGDCEDSEFQDITEEGEASSKEGDVFLTCCLHVANGFIDAAAALGDTSSCPYQPMFNVENTFYREHILQRTPSIEKHSIVKTASCAYQPKFSPCFVSI